MAYTRRRSGSPKTSEQDSGKTTATSPLQRPTPPDRSRPPSEEPAEDGLGWMGAGMMASLETRGAVPSDVAAQLKAAVGFVPRYHIGDGVAEENDAAAVALNGEVHVEPSEWNPTSPRGRYLILHEGMHAGQQALPGGSRSTQEVEAEADMAASAIMHGETPTLSGDVATTPRRLPPNFTPKSMDPGLNNYRASQPAAKAEPPRQDAPIAAHFAAQRAGFLAQVLSLWPTFDRALIARMVGARSLLTASAPKQQDFSAVAEISRALVSGLTTLVSHPKAKQRGLDLKET